MDPRKLLKDKLNRVKTELGAIRDSVLYDVHAFRERDPAAQSDAEVLLLYPGMHALLFHRAADFFKSTKIVIIRKRTNNNPFWFCRNFS